MHDLHLYVYYCWRKSCMIPSILQHRGSASYFRGIMHMGSCRILSTNSMCVMRGRISLPSNRNPKWAPRTLNYQQCTLTSWQILAGKAGMKARLRKSDSYSYGDDGENPIFGNLLLRCSRRLCFRVAALHASVYRGWELGAESRLMIALGSAPLDPPQYAESWHVMACLTVLYGFGPLFYLLWGFW